MNSIDEKYRAGMREARRRHLANDWPARPPGWDAKVAAALGDVERADVEIARLEGERQPGVKGDRRAVQRARVARERALDCLGEALSSE